MPPQAVEAEVTDDSPLALRAALLQARFLLGGPGARDGALAGLEELLKDPVAPSNGTLLYCAGACLHVAGRSDEALTLNHTGVTLENLGLCVAVGLALDRADFAGDVLTRMQAQDDDDTATQLATAWVGAYVGGGAGPRGPGDLRGAGGALAVDAAAAKRGRGRLARDA